MVNMKATDRERLMTPPKRHLSAAVLAALGLTTIEGCVGPCLDVPVDTDKDDTDSETDSETDVGPCLDLPVETDVGPCLSPEPPDTAAGDTGPDTDIGPCLDFPVDSDTAPVDTAPTDTSGSDTDVGPCLDVPVDSDTDDAPDTGLSPCLFAPCLSLPPSWGPDTGDTGSASATPTSGPHPADALPPDLRALLRQTRTDDKA